MLTGDDSVDKKTKDKKSCVIKREIEFEDYILNKQTDLKMI